MADLIRARGPQFALPYKAAKQNWYVFSGMLDGKVIYEKGFVENKRIKRLTIEHPASEKSRFYSPVSQIANSFVEWQSFTGKVLNVDTEILRAIDFADPNLTINELRRAYFDEVEAKHFEAMNPGDTITVEGRPSMVEMRRSSDIQAGLYEYRLENSVLKKVGR